MIYGHDRLADGARTAVFNYLSARGVKVILMESKYSKNGIMPDLLREMRGAAAFIAICTPDDHVTEGLHPEKSWWQPRQNVLFEMGIVYGLSRGAERLTVLQKWVDGKSDMSAKLPSDWEGYISLQFSDKIDHRFDDLVSRLTNIGVILDTI